MKRCRSGVMMHLHVWGKKTPRANPERTWTSNDLQKTSGKATINGRRRSTSRVEPPHDPEAAPQRPPRSGLVQRVHNELHNDCMTISVILADPSRAGGLMCISVH